MKHLVVILLVLTSAFSACSQNPYADRYTRTFSLELSGMISSIGLHTVLNTGIYRNGSKVDFGVAAMVYDVWKHGPGILGSYLSYKYYPNKRKNDFNLYFGYNNTFFVHNWGELVETIYIEEADITKHPDKRYQLENMFGIGFDVQMGNKFYMFHDYNAGLIVDWGSYHDVPTETEFRSTGMVRLGLGFNIAQSRLK